MTSKHVCSFSLFFLTGIFFPQASFSQSSTNFFVSGNGRNEIVITNNTGAQFDVECNTGLLSGTVISRTEGNFLEISGQQITKDFSHIGLPQLPVYNCLIEIPSGSSPEIQIISTEEVEIDLNQLGFTQKVIPTQPSCSKSVSQQLCDFQYDEIIYHKNQFLSDATASVSANGTMRGVQIGTLKVCPFSYNPVTNVLKVKKNIRLRVVFDNCNLSESSRMMRENFSPAFESSFSKLNNHQENQTRDSLTSYPITFLIVAPRSFEANLQPFIQWKTKEGFKVIVGYTDVIGATTTTIKNWIQNTYNTETPKPTYLLLAGDVSLIPTYNGVAGTHPTDLYYCTFDGAGDNIPEMYYGRFPADNTTELDVIIGKTLMHEQYTWTDESFLDKCLMIASVDVSYGVSYSNAQVYYSINEYFTTTNGYSNVEAFLNGVSNHPYKVMRSDSTPASADMKNRISNGEGFVYYTGHCDQSSWTDPSFTNAEIATLTNTGMYPVIVGNCCLSGKYSLEDAFGENMIKAADKGAVAYIGSSDSDFWDEDFFWTVGVNTLAFNTGNAELHTYPNTGQGTFDALWHTNAEPENDWYITTAGMIFSGNLAVEGSTSSGKKYYWEVYNVLGDPSLMPYLSIPTDNTVDYPDTISQMNLSVNCEPYSYVAVSQNNILLDAQYSGTASSVTLILSSSVETGAADVVVTKQNRKPYIGIVVILDSLVFSDIQHNPCADDAVGTATVTPTFGNPPYTFLWSNNATDSIITNLAAGWYFVTVTDVSTSSVVDSVEITAASPMAVSQFSASPLVSCDGYVTFQDQSTGGINAWQWDFGDGATSTSQNPQHQYTTGGSFSVKLVVENSCGFDTLELSNYLNINLVSEPTVFGDTLCSPGNATLSAAGAGTLQWFDVSTGGLPLETGVSFTTPYLTDDATFYVQNYQEQAGAVQAVGSSDVSTHGGASPSTSYLIFDAYYPVRILSVLVNNTGASGNRFFSLRDSAGILLDSITLNVPSGTSRISLNFDVPSGINFRLAVPANSDLWRNNSNVNYPYEIPGVISITGSSGGSVYYYYFYDWEIQTLAQCTSPRVPVIAVVDSMTVSISATDSVICPNQNVTFTATTEYAGINPSFQWYLNGNPTGVTSSVFASSSLTEGDFVYCIATSSAPCSIATDAQSNTISIQVSPDSVYHSEVNICQGDSTQIFGNWEHTSGIYRDTLASTYGCDSILEVLITTTQISVSALSTAPSLYQFNGEIDLSVSGGTGPYEFLWDNGETSEDVSNIGFVNNAVRITDANSCVLDTVIQVGAKLVSVNGDTVFAHPVCNIAHIYWGGYGVLVNAASMTDGRSNTNSIVSTLGTGDYAAYLCDTLTAYGFADWYLPSVEELNSLYSYKDSIGGFLASYYWSSSEIDENYAWIKSFSNGYEGSYIKNNLNPAALCIRSNRIDSNITLSFLFTMVQDISCFDLSNGSASVSPSGGTPPYTYLWSNNDTDSLASNLAAGWYFVTVTDAVMQSKWDSVEISSPAPIVVTAVITAPSLFQFNGSIDVTASGGTGTLHYLWGNGLTTQDFTNVGFVENTLTITDDNNCTLDTVFTVTSCVLDFFGDTLYVSPNDHSSGIQWGGSGTLVNASSDSDGSANTASIVNVLGANGGTPYAANLCDTLTDLGFANWYMPSKDELNMMFVNRDLIGNFATTSSYWSSTESDAGYAWLQDFSSGIQQVDDKSNQWLVRCIRKPENIAPLTVSFSNISNVSCFGLSDGTVTATASGGTPPYNYSWSSGAPIAIAINLSAGWYYVTVSDNAAHTLIDSVEIIEPPLIQNTIQEAICNGETFDFNGIILNTAGTYNDTMTALNGCDSVLTLNLDVAAAPTANISGPTEVCANTANTIYFTDSIAGANYYWNVLNGTITAGHNNPQISVKWDNTPGSAGRVELNVVHGCSAQDTMFVAITNESAPNIPTIVLKGENLLVCTDSGYTYQWYYNGAANADETKQFYMTRPSDHAGGNYQVEIWLSEGCTSMSEPFSFDNKNLIPASIVDRLRVFPNPFSKETNILIWLPTNSLVKVEIFNLLGIRVAEICNKEQDAGWNLFTVRDEIIAQSGMYLLVIHADRLVLERRIIKTE
ncbi:MAG: DUF1566 domain-containing protein [Bacteroidetes bacterium]|nr:DUF1566 domain-containing protein [Bacteroidota bacterium]MBU1719251.1 DUF1566 domain-containing protein [Bacteroidota bacterium]